MQNLENLNAVEVFLCPERVWAPRPKRVKGTKKPGTLVPRFSSMNHCLKINSLIAAPTPGSAQLIQTILLTSFSPLHVDGPAGNGQYRPPLFRHCTLTAPPATDNPAHLSFAFSSNRPAIKPI